MTRWNEKILFALALSGAAAVVMTFVAQMYGAWSITAHFHDHYGMPWGQSWDAFLSQWAARKLLTVFVMSVATFWGMAAWRLPIWIGLSGVIALSLAVVTTQEAGDPTIGIFSWTAGSAGAAAIFFLRFADWATRKWTPL